MLVEWLSAGLGCPLYNRVSVIYELANCLCPQCFHDQANGLTGKVISCPISVVSIRETYPQQRENTLDDIIAMLLFALFVKLFLLIP